MSARWLVCLVFSLMPGLPEFGPVPALGPAPASGQGPASETSAAPPGMHLVVVTGLGGEPVYREEFRELGSRLVAIALDRWGLPPSRVVWLAEDPALDPVRIAGRSTVEELGLQLRALAGRAGPSDRILIVFFGHGSARGEESVLNLPGPDLTGRGLASLLAPLDGRPVAVVNTASASGGFVPALAGPNRIVITATASPRERERTRFGRRFVDALAGDGSDQDRDGRVSLLEAFEFARREVVRSYESENQLLTEHALLEDDGDGRGSREPGKGADGRLARAFVPGGPAMGAAAAADLSDPEMAALVARRAELEAAVEALRAEKGTVAAAEYDRRLEALLLELARTARAIRERSGGGP